jgi:hypothetical protein
VKALVLIAAVAVLAVTTGLLKLKVEFFTGNASAGPTPAVLDAMAIANARMSVDGGAAENQVGGLVAVASKTGKSRGVLLIRQQLPPLAAQFEHIAPLIRERLLVVDVKTPVGRRCRVAALRFLAQEEWAVHRFTEDVALSRSMTTVVRRFKARVLALARRWVAQINACDAGLPPDERAGVAGALLSP